MKKITSCLIAIAGALLITTGEINFNVRTFATTQPNPIPLLVGLTPNSAVVGSTGFTLMISGQNFINNSVVRWNNSDRPTTFINSNSLAATILVNDLATAGTGQITVFNPAPGGGNSNALNFAVESAVIGIRLSYKIVLNPNGGTRPPDVTNADIYTAVEQMNNLMKNYLRGFRFQVVEILDIGANGQTVGPSQWYNTNFFAPQGAMWKDEMEVAAISDSAYWWRNNAVNIYITNGISGGICSFPGEGDNILIIGGNSDNIGWLQLHELGHYFNLCHTQGCLCACFGIDGCGEAPGDDEIADTLPDRSDWNQDGIANHNFGQPYAMLSPVQKNQVDNSFFNIMSYHGSGCGQGMVPDRLTEQQLDRWADAAGAASGVNRIFAVDSIAIFVDVTAPQQHPFFGSSANPYNNIVDAVNEASAVVNSGLGAVLTLRPGAFNQQLTIGIPLTLRATRIGPVTLGSATNQPIELIHTATETEKLLDGSPRIIRGKNVLLGFPGGRSKHPR